MTSFSPLSSDWYAANHRYLMGAIAQIRHRLSQPGEASHPASISDDAKGDGIALSPQDQAIVQRTPSALDHLCTLLGLSVFEREVILLCAGLEVDSQWGRLCAEAQGNPQREYPTWSLALAISSAPYWGALTPDSPLRRWQVIEIGPGNALATSPLRLDESIVHYLNGLHPLDERIERLGVWPLQLAPLVASHQALADTMANAWVQASQDNRVLPVLQLCGSEATSKHAIAATIGHILGLQLYAIAADTLPRDINALHLIGSLWEREWRLHRRVFLLDSDTVDGREGETQEWAIAHLLDRLQAPVLISSLDRRRPIHRPVMTLEVHQPSPQEQRLVWQQALGEMAVSFNGQIDRLVSHFNLSSGAIAATSLQLKSQPDTTQPFEQLWDVCRAQTRPRLDALAQRIEASSSWDDLVLPEKEINVLRDVAAHVRQRSKVYEQWGFGAKGQRGLGISALFSGASGTGKTLAAEVLGNALKLDVYRIDLSSVVSKYIGETEKNLRRVFDAAEGGGVILLFDEADALFGKRTEVKDSHDRHANIEVSYLLQRMESYRGLAILTTNLKASLDQAFLRRIRFIVQFPFPDASQRSEIWRRVFPRQTPVADLDYQKLAKLNVAGGNIRNIALNAAFLAADDGEAIAMKHILHAARSEYVKLERPLTDTEVKGWV